MSILLLTSCFKAMGWATETPQIPLSSNVYKLSVSVEKLSASIDNLTAGVDRLAEAVRNETSAHLETLQLRHTIVSVGRVQSAWRALRAGDRETAADQLDEAGREDAAHLWYWLARVELLRQSQQAGLTENSGGMSQTTQDISKLLDKVIRYMDTADNAADHAAALAQISVAVEFFHLRNHWPALIQSAVTLISRDYFPGPDIDEWQLQCLCMLLHEFRSEYKASAIEIPAKLFQQIDARLSTCSTDLLHVSKGPSAHNRFAGLLIVRDRLMALTAAPPKPEAIRGANVKEAFLRLAAVKEVLAEAEGRVAAIEAKITAANRDSLGSRVVSVAGAIICFFACDIAAISMTDKPSAGTAVILTCAALGLLFFISLWPISDRRARALRRHKKLASASLDALRSGAEKARNDVTSFLAADTRRPPVAPLIAIS